MKKRISIQYSINESNVANECYRLLDNTLNRLTSIAASTPPTESIVNTRTMGEIRNLRQELSEIDIELGDVHAIIDGFLDYQYSNKSQSESTSGNQQKIDIPDFLITGANNVNLDQLAGFIEQLKGTTPENFDMNQVKGLNESSDNFEASDVDPDKVKQVVENFQNTDLNGVDPQALYDTLSSLQNGSAKFDEIGERLKNLKTRVETSEIPD